MIKSLLSSRRFAPLFWCQFFSAFNDNFLKNGFVALVLFVLALEEGGALVQLAGAVLIAPFFLLSGLGGELADRYDKALIARRLKFAEIGVAAVASAGFVLHQAPGFEWVSIALLLVAIGLFGAISALFGPIKYGILPDHLKREELPGANALIEGATFLAILLGVIVGTKAMTANEQGFAIALGMIGLAVLSWASARLIPPAAEAAPDLRVNGNILASTGDLIAALWRDSLLWRGALATGWFWLVGAVVLQLIPTLVKDRLGGGDDLYIACITLFSVGVAAGSLLAAWMAHGRIILLPTPVGAILMGLFALDLGYATLNATPSPTLLEPFALIATGLGLRLMIDLVGLAVAAGLFIVPIFAAIQVWAGVERRARVIAGVNVVQAGFIVAGSLAAAALQGRGVGEPALIMTIGALTLAAGVLIFWTLPVAPLRDFVSILFRAVYRMEVRGGENLDKGGPHTIIALNHVSFLDAALALSLTDKEPVFAIDHTIARRWWVRPFLRLTKAMPLDPTKPMATRSLINAVRDGETLIIFPEGRLTVTGSLMKVYDGAGLIADKSDATVIPVRIDGLESTPFSRLSGAQVKRRWFPKVVVSVLEPVKLTVDPALAGRRRRQAAGAALYAVMSDLVFRTTSIERTVFQAVVEAADKHGRGRVAVEDPMGELSYRSLLIGAHALGRKLADFAPAGRMIGVLLPNSNGAAVTVLALLSAGRVPAMLNFSAGSANILSACKAAEVNVVLTSRAFIEKGRLDALIATLGAGLRIVYLEDVRAGIGLFDKARALAAWRRPILARAPDDPVAILFTSGSEGTPKGVVLSSKNMLANAAQAAARIDFGRTDKVFNVLPLFHSFGLTVGFVLPLISGVRVYLYPSPLHYRLVPELVYGANATILFGTDTFLAGYARSAHPYDFRSLRYVLAGAEPVKEATRKLYMEKFGLRILEGYGVTETAPVLALNTPMFNRYGTVGRILPGMEVRLEPVPGIAEGGRLFVRGPNVMLGYLRAERPGVLEPPPEGWHDTGDIVSIDAEGFVTIRGRAKRFAKVGGEMISLAAVEQLAAECWPDASSAVIARPDARKGERLALVTTAKGATRAEFLAHARAKGATELSVPAEVIVVEALPLLGSGKIDYPGLARLAAEQPGEAAA